MPTTSSVGDPKWRSKIERRVAAIRNGTARSVPAADVIAELLHGPRVTARSAEERKEKLVSGRAPLHALSASATSVHVTDDDVEAEIEAVRNDLLVSLDDGDPRF
jgi:hypothetical protein